MKGPPKIASFWSLQRCVMLYRHLICLYIFLRGWAMAAMSQLCGMSKSFDIQIRQFMICPRLLSSLYQVATTWLADAGSISASNADVCRFITTIHKLFDPFFGLAPTTKAGLCTRNPPCELWEEDMLLEPGERRGRNNIVPANPPALVQPAAVGPVWRNPRMFL